MVPPALGGEVTQLPRHRPAQLVELAKRAHRDAVRRFDRVVESVYGLAAAEVALIEATSPSGLPYESCAGWLVGRDP